MRLLPLFFSVASLSGVAGAALVTLAGELVAGELVAVELVAAAAAKSAMADGAGISVRLRCRRPPAT